MKLYTLDVEFAEELRLRVDRRVPIIKGNKAKRPFLGVVLEIDNLSYYIPLTSPKEKHLRMKDSIDFVRIDEGKLGALNLNNMIPVLPKYLSKIDLAILDTDKVDEIKYKTLLQNQISWCNKNINEAKIRKNAEKLYNLIIDLSENEHDICNKDNSALSHKERVFLRCCNFKKLNEYINNK